MTDDRLQGEDGDLIGPIEFLGTIPIKDGALQAHGEMGFRVTIDIAEDELPAYMRLHLMRGKVIRFRAEATDEIATPRTRRKKKVVPDNGETAERSEPNRRSDRELGRIRLH
jgi:hypothetical protein